MSAFDRVSLAAAEAARQTIGPRAGLRAARTLVDRVAGSERARAIFLGLDCATELGDRPGLDAFIARWRVQSGGDHFHAIADRCLRLRPVSAELARRLAEVECLRRPDDARARYLLGRLRGVEGREDLRRALRLAERPPTQPALAGAIRDRLTWLGEPPTGFDRGELADRARLGKARADLSRGGRYARVAALDALLELAEGALKREALALAAAHGGRAKLEGIELDRMRTLFDRHLAPAERARARLWIDAREALDEGREPPEDLDGSVARAQAALRGEAEGDDVTAAALAVTAASVTGGDVAAAAAALADRADAIEVADEPMVVAARLALGVNREAGLAVTERLLALPATARRGWLPLARALQGSELQAAALDRARAAGEPGAERTSALVDRAEAFAAARAGDEARAHALLTRARRVLR